jgi:hypothetical protein
MHRAQREAETGRERAQDMQKNRGIDAAGIARSHRGAAKIDRAQQPFGRRNRAGSALSARRLP